LARERGGLGRPLIIHVALLLKDEVRAPVLLPARFTVLGTNRFLFAVANGPNTIRRNSSLNHGILGGIRTIVA
jgi:hypothetical protein